MNNLKKKPRFSPVQTKKRKKSPTPRKRRRKSVKSLSLPLRRHITKIKGKRKAFSLPGNLDPDFPSPDFKKRGSPKGSKKGGKPCTYCGNNLLSPRLQANGGDCVLGSLYQCLQKGFGYGLHSPIDLEFINYEPIDPPENFYCGDKTPLPEKYDAFGRRGTCLRRGVGAGKKLRLQREGLQPNFQE